MQAVLERIDELPKPALIVLTIIGFMLFWPLGLAMLAICIWRGRMFGSHRGCGRWHTPGDRDAVRAEWQARKEEWRTWKRRAKWSSRHGSGNVAFDEYREETLRRLDDEQREFQDYLDKLRSAKDRAEFDQFMNERRNRPPAETPPPAPPAVS
jgi:hypothetical protein